MEALLKLVEDGVLTPEQEKAVEAALAGSRRPRGWLAEAGGYVGGLLLLGSALVFGSDAWGHLTRVERAGLLGGFAALFAIAGTLTGRGSPARNRLVGALYALAVVPAGAAVAVAVRPDPQLWAGFTALVVAAAGLVRVRTTAGLVAAVGASVWALIGLADEVLHATMLTGAVLTLGLGLAWSVPAALRRLPAPTVALSLGTATALVGTQLAADRTPWSYVLPLGYGLACVVAYPAVRSVVLLVAGVVALTAGVSRAVEVLTDGALSEAVVLACGGAALIAVCVFVLRTARRG